MSETMKVTICQLSDDTPRFVEDWEKLQEHVQSNKSNLLLLPEFTIAPWMAYTKNIDQAKWALAVKMHHSGISRFPELKTRNILGTHPIISDDGENYNEAFIWNQQKGFRASHRKYYLPEEPGFWEASWYSRGQKEFKLETIFGINIGFLICTEMWFTEHARAYAKDGIHLLATPRATEHSTTDRWLAGGRAAAIMSGAFCISSNKAGSNNGVDWGGCGWIIDPNGNILATTSDDEPFVTVEIDLRDAEKAKETYPRYVKE